MLSKLLLLFIVVPLTELVLLLYVADLTDWRFTLALVIVTGIVGTALARWQGIRTFQRIQTELRQQRMPTDALLDAVMIFFAGALLLTPGILTDIFGLSVLIPPVRHWYRVRLVLWLKSRFRIEKFNIRSGVGDDPNVVDSEFAQGDTTQPRDGVDRLE